MHRLSCDAPNDLTLLMNEESQEKCRRRHDQTMPMGDKTAFDMQIWADEYSYKTPPGEEGDVYMRNLWQSFENEKGQFVIFKYDFSVEFTFSNQISILEYIFVTTYLKGQSPSPLILIRCISNVSVIRTWLFCVSFSIPATNQKRKKVKLVKTFCCQ